MVAGIGGKTVEECIDLVRTTLNELPPPSFVKTVDLQSYEVMDVLLGKEKDQHQGGRKITDKIQVRDGDVFMWTKLFEDSDVQIKDVLEDIEMDWRHGETSYGYDRRENLFNRGGRPEQLVKLINTRRNTALQAVADALEAKFWGTPDPDDDRAILPLFYWLTKPTSSPTEGFTGGNPSGFDDVAGLDADSYDRWKNYQATYGGSATLDRSDIKTILRMLAELNFKPPRITEGLGRPIMNGNRRFYAGLEFRLELGAMAQDGNDNLGADVAKWMGEPMIAGRPVRYVPKLNDHDDEPFIALNLNYFQFAVKEGDYLHETYVPGGRKRHNEFDIFVDLTCNTWCNNRRAQGIMTNPDA